MGSLNYIECELFARTRTCACTHFVSDWTFNSVEGIVMTIYCVLINGNDIITFCRTCYIIYGKQHCNYIFNYFPFTVFDAVIYCGL